jgi:hypothetical protein
MRDLAMVYRAVKQPEKAVAILSDLVRIEREQLEDDVAPLTWTLAALGAQLLELARFKEADARLAECVALRAKSAADHWLYFSTKAMLGRAKLGQKQFGDAEKLLLAGYEGMKQREKATASPAEAAALQQRQIETLEALVALYDAQDQPDRVKQWRQQLEAARANPKK